MKETRTSRQFGLKDGMHRIVRDSPINRTFGPAGEAEARSHAGGMASTGGYEVLPNDGAEEDAAADWLAHVQAGRIGAEHRD